MRRAKGRIVKIFRLNHAANEYIRIIAPTDPVRGHGLN